MMRNTLITWVISHYLFGELCQRCQCITTTNQGITYHCFARLYLSSCTVELCCSALISSDDKESYSSPQSPVFSVRSYYYNEVNHWLQSSRWIWWLFSCAASVLPCSCSSPCSPRSPAELTRDRKKKSPSVLHRGSTGNAGRKAKGRRGPGLNYHTSSPMATLWDRQLADASQLCVKGLLTQRRELWGWQTSTDSQVNYWEQTMEWTGQTAHGLMKGRFSD